MADERQSTQEGMADILDAIERSYPGAIRAVNTTLLPTAQAQLAADKAVSPEYARINQELYSTYGPKEAATNVKIQDIMDQAASERELALAKGTGRELVTEADRAQRELDKEAYQARGELSGAISKYLGASDPTLTEAENEAIRRGIGRTSFNPQSANDTALAGMNFAEEFRNKTKLFGDAISRVAAAVPALQSGISGFEVATRRAVSNPNTPRTPTATQDAGANTYALANNFLNQAGNIQQQRMKKQLSTMDQVGQGLELGGRFTGGIMSMFG